MALGSTQPLTEMSTGVFPVAKGGRYLRLTTLPSSCAVVMKSGNLNFLEPSGPLQACNETALPAYLYEIMWKNNLEPGRAQMKIWRMYIACWILKVTDTHSEYVIPTDFPLQQ